MRSAVELSNIHDIVLVLQNGGLVVVDVEIVGSRENGHNTGETRGSRLAIHTVAGILGLMGANNREKVVLFQKGTSGRVGEEVRASSNVIVQEIVAGLLLAKVFERISPEDITHKTLSRRLAETVNL